MAIVISPVEKYYPKQLCVLVLSVGLRTTVDHQQWLPLGQKENPQKTRVWGGEYLRGNISISGNLSVLF